jgi:hypothetical protein
MKCTTSVRAGVGHNTVSELTLGHNYVSELTLTESPPPEKK